MKILYSWLTEFIENPPAPEELVRKLNRIGLKVENITKTGADFSGVVAARIEKILPHPNADKLHLVDVNDGEKVFRIVCGAKNITEGQTVPLAEVGARLPGGVLKPAKIRGVESCGMLCSCSELGIEGDASGIMKLPEGTAVGTQVISLYPKTDTLLEIETLPNQGHCLSHYAVARELSVFYGYKLKEAKILEKKASGASVPVEVEAPELCLRYTAIVMKNVKGGRTPDYIAERLAAVDCNPKGNILIDGSNYVMFEMGQPLHCFDIKRLDGPSIKVRRASAGEQFVTLDGGKHSLTPDNLVIADAGKASALAGVMGGVNSAVSDGTEEILIEAACFLPSAVRRSSKLANVKSESSYRFERGTDPEVTVKAARRFAELISEACPEAEVLQITDAYPGREAPVKIDVTADRINSILGTDLTAEVIGGCLSAFDGSLIPGGNAWTFTVPSYRRDISNMNDVAEEVARYAGYDLIPSVSHMPMRATSVTAQWSVDEELRRELVAVGFNEAYTYDFLSERDLKAFGSPKEMALEVKNPLSSDLQYLRPTLALSLLKALRYNINRGRDTVSLFEIGRKYSNDRTKTECNACAGLMYGMYPEEGWQTPQTKADFYRLKGVMERLFAGKRGFRFEMPKNDLPGWLGQDAALEMKLGGETLGFFGRVNKDTCAAVGIKDDNIYLFEINTEILAALWKDEFWLKINKAAPVSMYQQIKRDLSVIIDEKHEWTAVSRTFNGIKDLVSVRLTDVFRGKNIPAGFKSFTIRFTFSSMEKTFSEEDINGAMSLILNKLSAKFGAKLRE